MVELLIDPAIRLWVILPIVFITLVFGLLRHYVTVLLRNDSKTLSEEDIKDGCVLVCTLCSNRFMYRFMYIECVCVVKDAICKVTNLALVNFCT